jgi:Uma2 family endonuclease
MTVPIALPTIERLPTAPPLPAVTRLPRTEELPTDVLSQLWAEAWPRVDDLVTEDDTPVDNFPSAKQQRLLVESLYSSWAGPGEGRTFLADANVGLFYTVHQPPLVPDFFLSLDVEVAEDWWAKSHRSYFLWEFGKPPEVVIEIVSNTVGQETTYKLQRYARMGVAFYVIYDPQRLVQPDVLRVYGLQAGTYRLQADGWLEQIGLGITLWEGEYEGKIDRWLRWCDRAGRPVLTGAEQAAQERQRAAQERQRAEAAEQRLTQEQRRVEQLLAQLRALNITPAGK